MKINNFQDNLTYILARKESLSVIIVGMFCNPRQTTMEPFRSEQSFRITISVYWLRSFETMNTYSWGEPTNTLAEVNSQPFRPPQRSSTS